MKSEERRAELKKKIADLERGEGLIHAAYEIYARHNHGNLISTHLRESVREALDRSYVELARLDREKNSI